MSSSGFACLVLSSPRNANRNGWSAEACDGPVGGRNGEGKWTPFGGRQRLVKSLMLGPLFEVFYCVVSSRNVNCTNTQ